MNPKLIVEQKITAFVNKYSIYETVGGQKGQLKAQAQQKRVAFKEKVRFYSDEAKTDEVFGFRAEKVLDVHGRYFVEDVNGNLVGMFRKQFSKSLLVSTWEIVDNNDNVLFTIAESNVVLAVMRRYGGFLPFVGDFVDLLTLLFKYHFDFIDAADEKVGKYQKTTLFRDHYELSMTDDAYAKADWRVFAAIAVALDALQSR